jgi:hypothetical protein
VSVVQFRPWAPSLLCPCFSPFVIELFYKGNQYLTFSNGSQPFATQVPHLTRRRLPRRIAGKPPLPGLEELFRPAVVEAFGDALAPAQFGDRILVPEGRS